MTLLWAAPSAAHLRFPGVAAERWIELRLAEEPVRIGYRIGFGAKLADEVRRAADKDGDFEVSAVEGNAALDARSLELISSLRVCTGGTLADVSCRQLERRDIERVEAEGWVPGPNGHLHFTWTLELRERARDIGAIRLEDGFEVAGVEITDVQIDAPAHSALSLAGEAGRPAGVVQRFSWIEGRRAPGPRAVVAAWTPPRPSALGRILIPLVLLGIVLAFWLGSRAVRRAAPS